MDADSIAHAFSCMSAKEAEKKCRQLSQDTAFIFLELRTARVGLMHLAFSRLGVDVNRGFNAFGALLKDPFTIHKVIPRECSKNNVFKHILDCIRPHLERLDYELHFYINGVLYGNLCRRIIHAWNDRGYTNEDACSKICELVVGAVNENRGDAFGVIGAVLYDLFGNPVHVGQSYAQSRTFFYEQPCSYRDIPEVARFAERVGTCYCNYLFCRLPGLSRELRDLIDMEPHERQYPVENMSAVHAARMCALFPRRIRNEDVLKRLAQPYITVPGEDGICYVAKYVNRPMTYEVVEHGYYDEHGVWHKDRDYHEEKAPRIPIM